MKPVLHSPPKPQEFVDDMRIEEIHQVFVRRNIFGLTDYFPPSPRYDGPQRFYIDEFLNLVNLFCEHYELDQCFFDRLDQAAILLIKLSVFNCEKKLLPEYFEKTAMIFQIAADKTEMKDRQIAFTEKAKYYLQQADEARIKFLSSEPLPSMSHEERMSQLFQFAAKNYCKDAPYNQPYFQALANKYIEKSILCRLREIKDPVSRNTIDLSEAVSFLESVIQNPINDRIRKEAVGILGRISEQQSSVSPHTGHGFFSSLFYKRDYEMRVPLLSQETKKTK